MSCIRDTVEAGQDAPVIVVEALVGAGVADGTTLANTAAASTSTPGDNLGNNIASAEIQVQARADLVLTKSHSTGAVQAGTMTSFDITVSNDGPSDAAGPLTVTDTLPVGVSFLAATGWDGWRLGLRLRLWGLLCRLRRMLSRDR